MIALLPILKRFAPYLAALAVVLAIAAYAHHKGYQAGIQHEAPTIAALNATIADVRAKTAQAKVDDLAHARTVEASQTKVTNDVSTDYQQQLVALRARYDRLRAASPANPGGGGAAGLPGLPDAAGRLDGPAEASGLHASDALTASEQAYQLQALQDWVTGQQAIER